MLTATIKTAVSEHEISMMKIRMRRAAKQKAERGEPKWKRAFGYSGDTYQLDPHTAPLVKQAYAAVLAGSSLGDVARMFNDAGAYGLTGRPWTQSTVSLFLRKPRNAGLRAHNGEIVGKGTWPALVDESTWRAAQSVLDAPGRAPGRKSVRRHLLTGVLQCGKCGHHVVGQWTREGKIAYSCRACRGVSIRAEHVEPLLYGVVSGRLAMPDAIDLLKAELHDEAEAEALRIETQHADGRAGQSRRGARRGSADGTSGEDRHRHHQREAGETSTAPAGSGTAAGVRRAAARSARGCRRGQAAVTGPFPRCARRAGDGDGGAGRQGWARVQS